MQATHDMVVVGADPSGLSIAIEAQRAGLDVVVLAHGSSAVPSEAVGRYHLTVRYGAGTPGIVSRGDVLDVTTPAGVLTAPVVVEVVSVGNTEATSTHWSVPGRIHRGRVPADIQGADVLVVGSGDAAASLAFEAEAAGAAVVVSFADRGVGLSPLALEYLLELEHGRRLTVLWQSPVAAVDDVDGFPMVAWDDRRTPDLVFDHVVVAGGSDIQGTSEGGRVTVPIGAHPTDPWGPARAWETLRATLGERLPPLRPTPPAQVGTAGREVDELRLAHYNATITVFEHSHEDLWVLRVRPDKGGTAHRAGQYATLGLGYWEPRVDDARDPIPEERRGSLIRRSYSISSRMLDDVGYLVDPHDEDEIEFYVVHVRPEGDRVPALTPRLAAKRPGDRIYLGPKVAGRYTLAPVTDPDCDVVFLATGTGEAPHNAMAAELLRKRHRGAIHSVVTVRYLRDLGYADTHRRLEDLAPNYRYLAMPTREPDGEKRYIQDLVASGDLAEMLPHGLDPAHTHVFLCGNPAMIGVPETKDADATYPEGGVVRLLVDLGFVPDRRGSIGTVHVEEYW